LARRGQGLSAEGGTGAAYAEKSARKSVFSFNGCSVFNGQRSDFVIILFCIMNVGVGKVWGC